MSVLLGVLVAIYSLSIAIAAGGGMLFTVSPGFRRFVRGDMPPS